jgi:hypothetical protein
VPIFKAQQTLGWMGNADNNLQRNLPHPNFRTHICCFSRLWPAERSTHKPTMLSAFESERVAEHTIFLRA